MFSSQYSITWEKDVPLGIWLEPNIVNIPVVARVVNKAYTQVSIGDLLIAINGQAIVDPFERLMNIIQTIPRPLSLTFEVPTSTLPPASSVIPYSVVWPNGVKLGATFSFDPQSNFPRVDSLDSAEIIHGMEQARLGDYLVSVSGEDTRTRTFEQVMFLLQTLQRPITLGFESPVVGRESARLSYITPADATVGNSVDYDIMYSGGQLGLVLIEGSTTHDPPVIYKIKDKKGLEQARKGDELISIGEKKTIDMGFSESVSLMKHIQHPTLLRFRHSGKKLSYTGLIFEAMSSMFV